MKDYSLHCLIELPLPCEKFSKFRGLLVSRKKHLYFIRVSGPFLGTSLPPTPNWSRFDLFIDVYSILFIVFLATHCILFIVFLHVEGNACSTPPSFMGFCFSFSIFCHYFSVSVVCFFAVLCEQCEQYGSFAFQNCAAGEASFSHVLRCWFCLFSPLFRVYFT